MCNPLSLDLGLLGFLPLIAQPSKILGYLLPPPLATRVLQIPFPHRHLHTVDRDDPGGTGTAVNRLPTGHGNGRRYTTVGTRPTQDAIPTHLCIAPACYASCSSHSTA